MVLKYSEYGNPVPAAAIQRRGNSQDWLCTALRHSRGEPLRKRFARPRASLNRSWSKSLWLARSVGVEELEAGHLDRAASIPDPDQLRA